MTVLRSYVYIEQCWNICGDILEIRCAQWDSLNLCGDCGDVMYTVGQCWNVCGDCVEI
jgi:hypothetical protein